MKAQRFLAAALALTFAPVLAMAQMVVPGEDQPAAQIAADHTACAQVARQQTGFDPAAPMPVDASAQVAAGGGRKPKKKSPPPDTPAAQQRRADQAAFDQAVASCLSDRGYTLHH
jgi:hypothetical protein